MDLFDIDKDGKNELIVGTDDYAIRFYKQENTIFEINENTKIIIVTGLGQNRFLYGLENGTIGVYKDKDKIWKDKVNKSLI